MRPEEIVEIKLWDWLKTRSENVLEVYFNRKNILNSPVFNVKGNKGKKPDFIIKLNRGFGIEYLAIEIKDNSKSSQVYDGNKIINYYKDYLEGKTEYFIKGNKINIGHFLVATQGSIYGHLLKREKEGNLINNLSKDTDDQWKKTLCKYGHEPIFEFRGTAQIQRNLLASFREFRKGYNYSEEKPSLGILITRIFEDESTDGRPWAFLMSYNKNKWGCRYWEL